MKSSFILFAVLISSCAAFADDPNPGCLPDYVIDGGLPLDLKPDGTIALIHDSSSGTGNKRIIKAFKLTPMGPPGSCKLGVSFNPDDQTNHLDLRINLTKATANIYALTVDGKPVSDGFNSSATGKEPYSYVCQKLDTLAAKFPSCTNLTGGSSSSSSSKSSQ